MAVTMVFLAAAMIGGATMAWFTDSDTSEPVTMTAGTVLIEAGSSSIGSQYFDPDEAVFLYGIQARTGDIYEINVKAGKDGINRIYEGEGNYGVSYPNGLAFDDVNDRLYFATSNTELKFFDFNEGTVKKASEGLALRGMIMCATFGDGYYWFIPEDNSQHGNGKWLYRFKIDPDTGKIVSGSGKDPFVKLDEISGFPSGRLNYGDISIDYKNGIIYGSAKTMFFSYNLTTSEFKDLGTEANWLQLAYGSDGNFYGHSGDKNGTGDWYKFSFDDDGKAIMSESMFKTDVLFVDLASGYNSVWNPGDDARAEFNVKNVGTKNSYVRLKLNDYWMEYNEVSKKWVEWEHVQKDCPDGEKCPNPEGNKVVEITPSGENWEKIGGYYYYKGVLGPGEIAELSLKVHLSGPDTCNAYQGKRFVLEGMFDAIQTTNGASESSSGGWSMTFDGSKWSSVETPQ